MARISGLAALGSRNATLDVFRGMTVTFMIIVNTPGAEEYAFAPLRHASWHGFTPTDLVFPSFLFAVGNSLTFALSKLEKMGTGAFLSKVFKRAFIIFLLGFLMYWFPFFERDAQNHLVLSPIENTRIMGVLQRIALSYLFGSLIIYFFKERGAILSAVFLLLLYWIIMLGFGSLDLENNAVLKLDTLIFGKTHLYTGYTSSVYGKGFPFDPEGILSTMTAIVNVLAGYLAGNFIRKKGYTYETIAKMGLAGALYMFIAYWWNMVFPVNKPIWSSSYVLLTIGLDLIILSALIYILEIVRYRNWTYFFEVFGRNTLALYILSELLVSLVYILPEPPQQGGHSWTYEHIFRPVFGDSAGSLAFAFSYMLLCWSVGYLLDRRKIYIKV